MIQQDLNYILTSKRPEDVINKTALASMLAEVLINYDNSLEQFIAKNELSEEWKECLNNLNSIKPKKLINFNKFLENGNNENSIDNTNGDYPYIAGIDPYQP